MKTFRDGEVGSVKWHELYMEMGINHVTILASRSLKRKEILTLQNYPLVATTFGTPSFVNASPMDATTNVPLLEVLYTDGKTVGGR